jgi:hypothetical protein
MFLSSGKGREAPTTFGSLERPNLSHWTGLDLTGLGPNRVDASLPSPEDGNSSNIRNIVFSSYLKFQTSLEPFEVIFCSLFNDAVNTQALYCWMTGLLMRVVWLEE